MDRGEIEGIALCFGKFPDSQKHGRNEDRELKSILLDQTKGSGRIETRHDDDLAAPEKNREAVDQRTRMIERARNENARAGVQTVERRVGIELGWNVIDDHLRAPRASTRADRHPVARNAIGQDLRERDA